MKLIVPLYDLKHLAQILAIAGKCEVIVIANVYSGPGAKRDPAWAKAIGKLRKAGMTVLGYIDAKRWPDDGRYPVKVPRLATIQEMRAEANDWAKWYGVMAYFYDDAAMHSITLPAKGDVLNWGCEPEMIPQSGVIAVVHEGHDYLKSKPSRVLAAQQIVMALNQADWKPALALAASRRVAAFFATPRRDTTPAGAPDWTTYDELPSYLLPMASAVGKVQL